MTECFYQDARDALVGFLPEAYARFHHRLHGRGLKVWFGDAERTHYEIQEVGRVAEGGREHVRRGLEIGFHAELRDPAANEAVLAVLVAAEPRWRPELGPTAQVGYFVGDRDRRWRRVSEFWTGPEIDEPDTAIEAADRLAVYIVSLEGVRAGAAAAPSPRPPRR